MVLRWGDWRLITGENKTCERKIMMVPCTVLAMQIVYKAIFSNL